MGMHKAEKIQNHQGRQIRAWSWIMVRHEEQKVA